MKYVGNVISGAAGAVITLVVVSLAGLHVPRLPSVPTAVTSGQVTSFRPSKTYTLSKLVGGDCRAASMSIDAFHYAVGNLGNNAYHVDQQFTGDLSGLGSRTIVSTGDGQTDTFNIKYQASSYEDASNELEAICEELATAVPTSGIARPHGHIIWDPTPKPGHLVPLPDPLATGHGTLILDPTPKPGHTVPPDPFATST